MTNIYVGNLPYATHEDQLIEHFGRWGTVERATLVFDRETGRPRGFGFVEMIDPDAAQKAIEESHGEPFHGRPLTVNQARPRGSGNTSQVHAHARTVPNEQHPYRPTPSYSAADTAELQPVGCGYSNSIYK